MPSQPALPATSALEHHYEPTPHLTSGVSKDKQRHDRQPLAFVRALFSTSWLVSAIIAVAMLLAIGAYIAEIGVMHPYEAFLRPGAR